MLHINPQQIPTIEKLVDMARPILFKRNQLYNRINRGATQSTMMFYESDKAKVAFEQQNVGVATGYLGGIEPTITNIVDDELNQEYLSKLNDILRYNDFASKHLSMVRNSMSANAYYFYIYTNIQGRIVFSGVDGKNTIAFYDYNIEPNIVLLLRQWEENDQENNIVNVAECITATEITQYVKVKSEYVQRGDIEELNWGDIPVCSFESDNDIALIEPIIPLIKMYEQIVQNIASMTQYNDEAKLVMKGFNLDCERFDTEGNTAQEYKRQERALLESKVLEADGDGGFEWLLKTVDYSGMLEVLKVLHQLIMFIVTSPDTTDTTFSAAESSIALRLKMFPFEQVATAFKALYKIQYLRLIEIITNRLNFLKDSKLTNEQVSIMSREEKQSKGLYDFANIEVEINVNIPSDKLKSLNLAEAMVRIDKFSDKTILATTGMVQDVNAEIEKKKKQDLELFNVSRTGVIEDEPMVN